MSSYISACHSSLLNIKYLNIPSHRKLDMGFYLNCIFQTLSLFVPLKSLETQLSALNSIWLKSETIHHSSDHLFTPRQALELLLRVTQHCLALLLNPTKGSNIDGENNGQKHTITLQYQASNNYELFLALQAIILRCQAHDICFACRLSSKSDIQWVYSNLLNKFVWIYITSSVFDFIIYKEKKVKLLSTVCWL